MDAKFVQEFFESVAADWATMRLAYYDESVIEKMAEVAEIDSDSKVEHSYAWMREEHADVWLGFGSEQVERSFAAAGLEGYGYESLGMQ